MFLSRNKKSNVYPCELQFYYIKVGFKGQNYIGMFSWWDPKDMPKFASLTCCFDETCCSNYPCLEQISVVPKMLQPLKFNSPRTHGDYSLNVPLHLSNEYHNIPFPGEIRKIIWRGRKFKGRTHFHREATVSKLFLSHFWKEVNCVGANSFLV